MLFFPKPKLRLGYVPTRRDMFLHPMYKEIKANVDDRMCELAEAYDFTLITTQALSFPEKTFRMGSRTMNVPADDLMTDYADAKLISEYFRAEHIDALFVPFCNFGQEEAVARLAKDLNVPLLVWAPRDPAPIGLEPRQTDSQCGIFAATKVLQRYGVTFTYIENCRLEDPVFERDFARFLSTAQIVKAFRNARIAQISVRPQQFLSVMVNEAELLEKFGVELVPITGTQLVNTIQAILESDSGEIDELVEDIEKTLDMSRLKDKRVIAAIELGLMQIARDYCCSAIACDCWHTIRNAFGVAPCFIFGDLNDRGLPCACELDIHAAIASLMAVAATGHRAASFVADLTIRHPEDDNCELLWHCGPFAKQLKEPSAQGYIVKDGQGFYPLKKGELTILRFDGLNGNYKCLVGKGNSIEGPVTNGNYVWFKVEDWIKWEKKFVYGPYIHHVVGVFGDHVEALKDACRYLNIQYDTPDSPLF